MGDRGSVEMPDAQLEQMYQEVILDHYRNPRGSGLREPFDAEVHQVNPVCGDEITLRLSVAAGGPTSGREQVDVSYDAQGCSISQASASVMFDQIEGRSIEDALAAGEEFRRLMNAATAEGRGSEPDEEVLGDGIAFAGVARYPARIKCALLPWMALREAVLELPPSLDRQDDASHDDGGGR